MAVKAAGSWSRRLLVECLTSVNLNRNDEVGNACN